MWRKNITGRGVVVTILDDGIEYTHPDLRKNYEAKASWDFNNHDSDPMSRYSRDNLNKHGTRYLSFPCFLCSQSVFTEVRIHLSRVLEADALDRVARIQALIRVILLTCQGCQSSQLS